MSIDGRLVVLHEPSLFCLLILFGSVSSSSRLRFDGAGMTISSLSCAVSYKPDEGEVLKAVQKDYEHGTNKSYHATANLQEEPLCCEANEKFERIILNCTITNINGRASTRGSPDLYLTCG